MKAKWIKDYDLATDSIYGCPGCPECDAPVFPEDDRYRCVSCGQEVEIDHLMRAWFEARNGEKVELEDCVICDGEKTVEAHYSKNRVNLEWQCGYGRCKKCGMQFIV